MWPVRLYRKLSSRTKHREAPTEYPLTILRGDDEEAIKLPLKDYPILLHFPVFLVPAYLEPTDYTHGIKLSGMRTISFGPRPEDVIRKYGATGLRVSENSKPVEFARVIAKVAYSWAVAEGALQLIEGKSFVAPAILGATEDIGRWVGTVGGVYDKEGAVHTLILRPDVEKRILIGEVRLFADSQAPAYCVILGRLREGQSNLAVNKKNDLSSDESSLQFVHCLICDSIQIEPRGKATISGFFGITPDVKIVVQSLLNPIEQLTVILLGRGPTNALRKLTVEIRQPTGRLVSDPVSTDFGLTGENQRLIVKLQGIRLSEAGEYSIRVYLDSKENYRTTFRVVQGNLV